MVIEAGQQLLHYRLIDKIGEGGMGVVWRAEDVKLGRQIALKVLPDDMAADPDRRARFEREARAVAALNHPNIVTLHSVDQADGADGATVLFITMELVEGKRLKRLLPKTGLPLDRLLDIAIPLADAVSTAHRAGITHRDLKPDNVMIGSDGRLRVLDFGLAKLQEPAGRATDAQAATATITSDTVEGRLVGTVAYMSPEQAEGKPVDARSDIFALGTILYEMASGRRPFHGDTTLSTLSAILKDEPPSITDIRPTLPRHAARIIRRCLAKDPERRYQTSLDLRNDLEELQSELQSGVHSLEPPNTKQRRSGTMHVTIVVAGVALAIVAGVLVVPTLRRDASAPVPSFTSVPLTSGLGLEISPSWSPGGEFLAYSQVRKASMDVVVQPMAGGEPVVRAEGAGDEIAPRWSRDGQYIAYVSTSEPGSPLFLAPPHGGPARKLLDTNFRRTATEPWSAMGNYPWSPDGDDLLVSLSVMAQSVIHRVDRETGDAMPLTIPPPGQQDHSASYSPDGRTIVFARGGLQYGELRIMPADGREPDRPVRIPGFATADVMLPTFRQDGRNLVFNTSGNLWELALESGRTTQLTFDTQAILSFALSSTGRIAYQTFWHDQFLYAIDVATGERRQLTSHTKENMYARFAPDGKTIAYASTRTGDFEIYLLPVDGGSETRITNRAGADEWPDWSPDGARLIYTAPAETESAGRRLMLVNRDGGGARVVVEEPGFGWARWSPSGERIAYVCLPDGMPTLCTVRPDGSDRRPIHPRLGGFDWYVDDRRGIYGTLHGTEAELVALNLETGETRSLYVGPILEFDVAPDGSAVALSLGQGHISLSLALLRLKPPSEPGGLPTAVGEPEIVLPAEGTWHVHLGGWSPDSKQIVYTHDQDYGDLFELVAN